MSRDTIDLSDSQWNQGLIRARSTLVEIVVVDVRGVFRNSERPPLRKGHCGQKRVDQQVSRKDSLLRLQIPTDSLPKYKPPRHHRRCLKLESHQGLPHKTHPPPHRSVNHPTVAEEDTVARSQLANKPAVAAMSETSPTLIPCGASFKLSKKPMLRPESITTSGTMP